MEKSTERCVKYISLASGNLLKFSESKNIDLSLIQVDLRENYFKMTLKHFQVKLRSIRSKTKFPDAG